MKESEIKAAFAALMAARQALHEASEKELVAKTALKKKEAGLLLAGSITGKNAETRDAQLKDACQGEIAALEGAEAEKRLLQCRFDLASMGVDELKWLIRNDQAMADSEKEARP